MNNKPTGRIDLAGKRFFRLIAKRPIKNPLWPKRLYWECLCDCGNLHVVESHALRDGRTKSCGCFRREFTIAKSTKHGAASRGHFTKEYLCWTGIKARCCNPKNDKFHYYGGRGIRMCEQWLNSFNNFYAHMGNCPPGMTIDRWPDKNGNYEPGNCRWATGEEQANNKRTNVIIEFQGKKLSVAQWARELGVRVSLLRNRLKSGWLPDRALSEPVQLIHSHPTL